MAAAAAASSDLIGLLSQDHIRPFTDTLTEFEKWSFDQAAELTGGGYVAARFPPTAGCRFSECPAA